MQDGAGGGHRRRAGRRLGGLGLGGLGLALELGQLLQRGRPAAPVDLEGRQGIVTYRAKNRLSD